MVFFFSFHYCSNGCFFSIHNVNIIVLNGFPVKENGFWAGSQENELGPILELKAVLLHLASFWMRWMTSRGSHFTTLCAETGSEMTLDFCLFIASKYQKITQIVKAPAWPQCQIFIYLGQTIRTVHTSEGLFTICSLGLMPPNPISAVLSVEPLPSIFYKKYKKVWWILCCD